jgi:hypothetical protein
VQQSTPYAFPLVKSPATLPTGLSIIRRSGNFKQEDKAALADYGIDACIVFHLNKFKEEFI